jgi:hypothetical protein
VTERGVRGDWDFHYLQAESDDDDGWFGSDRATPYDHGTEPIPVAEIHERLPGDPQRYEVDEPESISGYSTPPVAETSVPDETEMETEYAPPPAVHRVLDDKPGSNGYPAHVRPRPIASNFADSFRNLSFKVPATPWYRSKKAAIAAAVVAVVAAGLLIVRMPGGGSGQSTTVVPDATTTAVPAPTSAQPALTHAEPTPPALPPPPEPASPPVYTGGGQWEPSAPSPQKPPQIDVTRAPISVAPPTRTAPGSGHDSSTPGDGRRPGGWNW